MYFSEKESKNSRSELSHLRAVRYWYRPGGGLAEVIKKMKEKNVVDPTFLNKSDIELYIGSLFGMGWQESDKLDFWMAKPNDDPPDMAFMTMVQDEKGKTWFHSREVEITRCLQDSNIVEAVLKKDKPYPGDYVIVCFLEHNGIENLKRASDELVKKLRNIKHVFLVFHGILLSDLGDMPAKEATGKVGIVQLSPTFNVHTIDIAESLKEWANDNKKLIYTENAKIYYGLRDGESTIPNIV